MLFFQWVVLKLRSDRSMMSQFISSEKKKQPSDRNFRCYFLPSEVKTV